MKGKSFLRANAFRVDGVGCRIQAKVSHVHMCVQARADVLVQVDRAARAQETFKHMLADRGEARRIVRIHYHVRVNVKVDVRVGSNYVLRKGPVAKRPRPHLP